MGAAEFLAFEESRARNQGDALRQCQRLPTLCAIQHFEKQSCGAAAE